VMAQLSTEVFRGRIADAALIDVLDAFYAGDPARARTDGYLRLSQPMPTAADAFAAIVAIIPDIALPRATEARTADDLLILVNHTFETARDPRRVFRLETRPGVRAYFILGADRAKRLSKILPFA